MTEAPDPAGRVYRLYRRTSGDLTGAAFGTKPRG